jgi:ligand-binding sensor domain-containing protein
LPSPSVTAAASCKTQIFVGSANGLAVYKKGTTAAPVIYQYPELPHNYITAVQCADTQAFVGTMSGIVRISGDYAYPISSIVANKMVVANQKLWVASSQGLFQFDMQGRLIKRWDVNNGLYSSNVTTLTVDRNNVVYAFDGQNIVRMSDMKKFPIGTPVYDLAYLNGVFYIATPDGLFSTYDFMDFVNVYSA